MTKRASLALDVPPVSSRRRVGIEQELRLWNGEQQVDFRLLLPQVAGNLRLLDPGDPRARRLPSGAALTADGWEAELASPPHAGDGDVSRRLDSLLSSERSHLRSAVEPLGVERITGYSTHVNVSVSDAAVVEVGRAFVGQCGLVLTMLAEPSSSAGVFIRPRRGRLELGTEYAEGRDLERIVTFALCGLGALERGGVVPNPPTAMVEMSREKFGWHLPVGGPVKQFLIDGRRARLEGAETAQDVLARVWEWARPEADRLSLDTEAVDELIDGAPLRSESDLDPASCSFTTAEERDHMPDVDTSPRILTSGTHAETAWLTWEHVVWEFRRRNRRLFAAMHVSQEPHFLRQLDEGALDETVERELARRLRRRRLTHSEQLHQSSWWHDLRPLALVPAERSADGSVPAVR